MNLQQDLLTNFNTACSSVSLHRQLKTRMALPLAAQGYYYPTDTLHQPVKIWKKTGEMTQQIKTFSHTYQGAFMWNESVRGVYDQHSLFKQW